MGALREHFFAAYCPYSYAERHRIRKIGTPDFAVPGALAHPPARGSVSPSEGIFGLAFIVLDFWAIVSCCHYFRVVVGFIRNY